MPAIFKTDSGIFGDIQANNMVVTGEIKVGETQQPINTYITQEINTVVGDGVDYSSEINIISGSIDTVSGDLNTLSGVVDGLNVGGETNLNEISGNLNIVSGSVDTISGDLDTLEGIVDTATGNIDTISGAVEEILNAEAADDTAFNSVSGSVDTISGDLDTLEGIVDTATGNIDTISGAVEEILNAEAADDTAFNTVSGSVDTISGDLDTLEGIVDTATGNIDTISGAVEEILNAEAADDTAFNTVSGSVDTISGDLDTLEGIVGTATGNIDTISGAVEEILNAEAADDTAFNSVSGSVDTISGDLDALEGIVDTATGNIDEISGVVQNLSANSTTYGDADVSTYLGGNLDTHILPSTNETYDIGSADKKIRHLYLSSNSLYIGGEEGTTGTAISATAEGGIVLPSELNVSGINISGAIGGVQPNAENDSMQWNESEKKWVAGDKLSTTANTLNDTTGDLYTFYKKDNSNIANVSANLTALNLQPTNVPTSGTAPGTKGEITYDENFVYLCVDTNKWRRLSAPHFTGAF
jgi:methyl-accepting chemotaxis protein